MMSNPGSERTRTRPSCTSFQSPDETSRSHRGNSTPVCNRCLPARWSRQLAVGPRFTVDSAGSFPLDAARYRPLMRWHEYLRVRRFICVALLQASQYSDIRKGPPRITTRAVVQSIEQVLTLVPEDTGHTSERQAASLWHISCFSPIGGSYRPAQEPWARFPGGAGWSDVGGPSRVGYRGEAPSVLVD
jgi:hypothetical protein